MLEQLANPTHPCTGCKHRAPVAVEIDSRGHKRPGTKCKTSGIHRPVFWGDSRPGWCPGYQAKGKTGRAA